MSGSEKVPHKKNYINGICYSLLFLISFSIVYRYGFKFANNSDNANTLLEGYDITHGNFFLKGWFLPPDSYWLLDGIGYAILSCFFGISQQPLHILPALIWGGIVVTVAYIINYRCKENYILKYFPLFALLVFPPLYDPTNICNFITQSPYHLGTVLASMWAMIGTYKYIKNKSKISLFFSMLVLIAIYVSDPFGEYVFIFPTMLSLFIISVNKNMLCRESIALLSYVFSIFFGIILKHVLDYVGGFHAYEAQTAFVSFDNIWLHINIAIQAILWMFGANFFGKQLSFSYKNGSFTQISHIILLIMTFLSIYNLSHSIRKNFAKNNTNFIDLTIFTCIVFCFISALMSNVTADISGVRYFYPIVIYSSIILPIYTNKNYLFFFSSVPIVLSICMFFVTWNANFEKYKYSDNHIVDGDKIVHVLEKENVYFGYSEYWHSSILSVFDNEIHTNAILYNREKNSNCKLSPYLWLTKKGNYNIPDGGKYQKFFIIVPDDDLSSNLTQGRVIAEMGDPLKIVRLNDMNIDIYDRSSLNRCPSLWE